MSVKLLLLITLLFSSISTHALTPSADFKAKENFGSVQNFHHAKEDIDLSLMSNDLKFDDLNAEGIKELNELFSTKKEYGKMFGFKEWTPVRQKLFESKDERTFVLEGVYKDAENKNVHFLEVYWASKTKAGQFLITSNTKKIALEEYKRLFNP